MTKAQWKDGRKSGWKSGWQSWGGGERVVTPSAIVLAACRQVDLLVENFVVVIALAFVVGRYSIKRHRRRRHLTK